MPTAVPIQRLVNLLDPDADVLLNVSPAEAAAKVAKHSVAEGLTIREAVIDLGFVERGEVTLELRQGGEPVNPLDHLR